jgi:gliding motility-associated-like protein
MTNFTFKYLLFIPIVCAFATRAAAKEGIDNKGGRGVVSSYNFTHFSPQSHEDPSPEWQAHNAGYMKHPDAAGQGHSKNGLIEIFSKRTRESKYYIKAGQGHSFVMDKSLGALHYEQNGQWLTLDGHLAPLGNGIYEAAHQPHPLGIDATRKAGYFQTTAGRIYANSWSLSGIAGGRATQLATANWSSYTAGDDGVYITDIFPGIDAEMRLSIGSVKTNFIVHQNRFPGYDQLVFTDKMVGANGALAFADGRSGAHVAAVDYKVNGKAALHIDPAFAFAKNAPANGIEELAYQISRNELSVLINKTYLTSALATGDVIIDPKVTVAGTLPIASITGSMNCGSTTNYCSYNLSVTPPAGAIITRIYDRFSIFTSAPATVGQSNFAIATNGGCVVAYAIPANTQTNIAFGTKDTGSNQIGFDTITNFVRTCVPAPSCNPAPIIFQLRLWNTYCATGPTGCSNVYNSANEAFQIRIEGYTLQANPLTRSSNVPICPGTQVTLSRSGILGLQPYKYTWAPTGDTTSSITVSPSVTTLYTSTISDGCNTYTDTTTIIVLPQGVPPTFTSPLRICQFAAPQPLTAIGTNLMWYTTPTGGLGSTTPPIPPTQVPGIQNYYVTQSNICGTSAGALYQVEVIAKPAPPTVITPLRLCQYDTVQLSATGTDLRWYLGPVGGGGAPSLTPPTGGVDDSIFYYVTQTIDGCESDRSRLLVTVTYKPNGIINPSRVTLCQGELDTFFYFGNARPDAVYNWTSPHPETAEISGAGTQGPYVVRFDSAGTYNVNVQVNNRGCLSDIASQPIAVRSSPALTFSAKDDACVGELVNVALSTLTPRTDSFSYNFRDGIIRYGAASGGPYGIVYSTPGVKVISSTSYARGCSSRVTNDTIVVHELPEARFNITSIGGESRICNGDSLLLTALNTDSNTRFIWLPDNFYQSGNVFTAKGFLKKSGYIKLTATSIYGCIASDSQRVQTEGCCKVFFPNAFSPNGDTRNDYFRPVTRGTHEVRTFRIINRWGQVVYESQDERRGWDGSYNGKPQDMGTYYFYFAYSCGEGGGDAPKQQFEEKGDFLLIR